MMIPVREQALIPLMIALVYFGLQPARAAEAPRVELAGRVIQLELIRGEDRAPTSWPPGDSGLTTETIVLRQSTDVVQQLVANGIFPDSGSYSLLYNLNPTISKLSKVTAGTRLVMPVVRASSGLQAALANGAHYVALRLDPEQQENLIQSSEPVREAAVRFVALGPERFSETVDRAVMIEDVNDLAEWFEVIGRASRAHRVPPTSTDTLMLLADEARALVGMLNAIDSDGKFDREDQRRIVAIHMDIQQEIGRYDEVLSAAIPDGEPPPCCSIQVTIRGLGAAQLGQVRVYYTLEGLYRRTRPSLGVRAFPKLGSGASGLLRPKSYALWIARDGKPLEPLTSDALLVELTEADVRKEVELLVAHSGQR